MTTEDKKEHRTGWWRSFYYYMDWEYDSENDKPTEKDVLRKQVLMKQVGLSKLKMKKVIIEPSVPFDLQKINTEELSERQKRNILKEPLPEPPPSSPINISQKQKHHKVSYTDKLKLLKNL